jgi:E3 SUMO-protein ligase PIAS1
VVPSLCFHLLTIPRYVKDILKTTSSIVDQVTILPDGKWELRARQEPVSKSNGFASDDDDDDLIEITKSGDSIRMSTPRTYDTPALGSSTREASSSSAAPRGQGSTSGKRPIAAVIDLTSSGDEDEEPLARQPKRQFTGASGLESSTPAFRPNPANGYL